MSWDDFSSDDDMSMDSGMGAPATPPVQYDGGMTIDPMTGAPGMSAIQNADQAYQAPNMVGQQQAPMTPPKLIDSVQTINALGMRSNELASKILSDADQDTGLSKQLAYLNISEVNKATSKETAYKTEQDATDDFMNKILNHDNEDILKGVNHFSVSSERKKRYDIYEQMLESNYLSFRILRAYINGVLIINAQTKTFMSIALTDEKAPLLEKLGQDIGNSYTKFIKSMFMKFRLQQKLQEVLVPKTLLYGNYFVEIVDLNLLDDIAKHEQILMEGYVPVPNPASTSAKSIKIGTNGTFDDYGIFESNFECFKDDNELKEHITNELSEQSIYQGAMAQRKSILESGGELTEHAVKLYDIDSLFEDSSFNVSAYDLNFLDSDTKKGAKKYNLSDISKLDMSKLKDIHLNYVSPRNVIIIEKDSYIYGYLVVEDLPNQANQETVIDSFKRFSSGLNGSLNSKEESKDSMDDIITQITKEVLTKVTHNIRLNKVRSFQNNFNYFNTLKISDEAVTSLKLLIYSKVKQKSKLKFRFLTPESMVNFTSTVDKFAPYGTSIYDPLVGPVKLYSLALMSSVVSRLSRAAVMRKWTIETGGKRNHKEIVEKTKQELKSKSISYDKINTLQNISEIVTDFRDMATISINNQRFIDMEVLPMNDRGLPLNDLNDLKNDIIAAGGVPAVYLNLGDTTDLRETLVHLNVNFANDIINKQTSFEQGLDSLFNNLFKKVLKFNGYEDGDFYISNYAAAKLNPPLVLQIQSDEAMVTTVSNIIQMLQNSKVQVDPTDLFKRYIPSIDWDNLTKKGQTYMAGLGKNAIINAGTDGDPGEGAM